MTKRSRTFLFFVLTIFFLAAAPAIIFYSLGYRFDFSSYRFTQVGAFYFVARPTQAEIYVNNERTGETSWLTGNNLQADFLPGIYELEIRKQGFIPWKKSLEIFPRQVTEVKSITLFPENISFVPFQKHVSDFWVAPDNRSILMQIQQDSKPWTLLFFDTQNNAIYEVFAAQNPQDIVSYAKWSPDSKNILFRVASNSTIQTFIHRARETNQRVQSPIAQLPSQANRIEFSPSGDRLVFLSSFADAPALFSLDYQSAKTSQLIANNVLSFAFENQNIFWMDTRGIIWNQQSLQGTPQQITEEYENLPLDPASQLYVFQGQIFLQTPKTLFWLSLATQTFEEILSAPQDHAVSPDGKKIAFTNTHEILLYFLQDNFEQPPRKKEERIILTRFSERITNTRWINSNYLLFALGDTIQAIETDNRDRPNRHTLGTFLAPRFFWQSAQNILYVLSENSLHTSQNFW